MKQPKKQFKKLSEGNFFTLCGAIREAKKGVFETNDEALIEALKKHPDFKEIKQKGGFNANTKEK